MHDVEGERLHRGCGAPAQQCTRAMSRWKRAGYRWERGARGGGALLWVADGPTDGPASKSRTVPLPTQRPPLELGVLQRKSLTPVASFTSVANRVGGFASVFLRAIGRLRRGGGRVGLALVGWCPVDSSR